MTHEENVQRLLDDFTVLLAKCDQLQAEVDGCRELADELHRTRHEGFNRKDQEIAASRERIRNQIAVLEEMK